MTSGRAPRFGTLLAYGAATAAVPVLSVSLLAWSPVPRVSPVTPGPVTAVPESVPGAVASISKSDEEAVAALAGIWWKNAPGLDGDPIGFYYFHGDGKGLYRYGRVGLTNTHSFDYAVEAGALLVRFRKTGVEHRLGYRVESSADADWLTLEYDPEEQAHGTRYFRDRPGPIDPHGPHGGDVDPQPSGALGPAPAGHMWIDLQHYASGGSAFGMYQFRPAGIDGRGVGWFHRGDFDDWSTESFTYRIAGSSIDLHFTLADRGEVTSFSVLEGEPRALRLDADPRDYWHLHSYEDLGPSFGGAPAALSELAPVLAFTD